ncbi:MAG: NAAT family transporter [Deltaproteobacteria bacterium]|nr:NAAT family transporter [Deltaproteobacteria bacterium]
MLEVSEYAKLVAGLVAIVNPVGKIPTFINLTENHTREEQHRVSMIAAASVLIILLIFLVAGEVILKFFGIGVNSFSVAGGILIFLLALSMMVPGKAAASPAPDSEDDLHIKHSIGVVPLGTPMMAGPGAITTVVVYAHLHDSIHHYLMIGTAIVAVSFFTWGILRMAPTIGEKVGPMGMTIISRVMGLIMGAIAVEFIAKGLRGLFPVLQ